MVSISSIMIAISILPRRSTAAANTLFTRPHRRSRGAISAFAVVPGYRLRSPRDRGRQAGFTSVTPLTQVCGGTLLCPPLRSTSDGPELGMEHLYQEWTVEQDRILYENRNESLPKLASTLGRGLQGVKARLVKLKDVNSAAYSRLFVGEQPTKGGDVESKGGKLTPAMEVLRRIRWDATLSQKDFTVLYYDRVAEKIESTPFDAANDSVKGNEEMFVFAMPEHRITAVKYKERTVWDKDRRMDCVSGSMNSGETIDVVICNYDEWKREKDDLDMINRTRQAEVASRVQAYLGGERFEVLKDLSSGLQNPSGNVMATDAAVEQYVKSSLALFRLSREEDESAKEEDSSRRRLGDVKALYLLSELVALLPDDVLRERILLNIESTIDRLEGRKPKADASLQTLQELNEDELSEKFVRGGGAGGQKINKTASKVILVHELSQVRVECQDTRSLQQNRKIARKRLRLKLDEYYNGASSRTSIKGAKVATKKAKSKARNKARQRKKKEAAEKAGNA